MQNRVENEKFYRVQEVAEILGIHRQRVYEAIHDEDDRKRLAYYVLGGAYRISENDLNAWVRRNRKW